MFKNSVFKVSVDAKQWIKKASIRAVKTFFQSMGSMVTVGVALHELDWQYIASVATVAAIYSLITSMAGIPEAESKE